MAWFFADTNISGDEHLITGEDKLHIERSLRMKIGEELTIVTPDALEHRCIISAFTPDAVRVTICESKPSESEPSLKVTLFQSLTKGDKMDLVVQKSVELGVHRIVPVITSRCVSRPDERSLAKKLDRWRKIALGAAQQSNRGIVPQLLPAMAFSDAVSFTSSLDLSVIFYEGGGESLSSLLNGKHSGSMGIFVGCEGGFEASEISMARSVGIPTATLGKRILRAETAPLAALSAIMCLSGNLD